jgi:hypothetical protein
MQMRMVRYWTAHRSPKELRTLPSGQGKIEPRGQDTVSVNGKRETLDRYTAEGLIWGRETLWFDSNRNLIAAATLDAEFDHFEAVRDGCQTALGTFVGRAGADGMAALAEISKGISSSRADPLALVGGIMMDGTGRSAVPDSAIVIEKGRIVGAGPRSQVKIPSKAKVVDAHGKTILPGLWDLHAHFEQVEWGPIYLAAGVTTARDCGNEFEFITAVRDAIANGRGLGPRPGGLGCVSGNRRRPGPNQSHPIHRGDGVPAASRWAEAGRPDERHCEYRFRLCRSAEGACVSEGAHTVVDPTLALMELFTANTAKPPASFEPGVTKVARELAEQRMDVGPLSPNASIVEKTYEKGVQIVGALHRAGILVVAGTNQAVPGHSLHREIELYGQAGFTPMEAIQAATIVPARVMGLDKELGTVEAGKRADLILVDSNPLESIRNIRNGNYVITNGTMYGSSELWRSVGFEP